MMQDKNIIHRPTGNSRSKKLSLYPLKFEEVISDVLKVKPEPKAQKPQKTKKGTGQHKVGGPEGIRTLNERIS